MAISSAEREALIQAERKLRNQIRDEVTDYATTLWEAMGDWRDDDVAWFVSQVTPQVQAGQRTTAQVTDRYLSTVTGSKPGGLVDLAGLRGGVTPQQVYQRPAKTMRAELAAGKSFTDALRSSSRRLQSLVASDMQLANTRQARRTLTRGGKAQFYRRTLVGPKNCALCMIASTQRYKVGDLLPIHPGCNCGVDPLSAAEAAMGQVIDPEFLEQIHAGVEAEYGTSDRGGREIDYRKLVAVREHGEYGPTLTWERHGFRGPDGVTEPLPPTPEVVAVEQQPATSSWLFDSVKGDNFNEYGYDDWVDLLNEAQGANDPQAEALARKHLDKMDAQMAGYRNTGFTRAQLREQWDEYVERSYWEAEATANGFLLNEEGRRAGVSARSLFKGSEQRAYKYASDELKWYWQDNPRLTFDAYTDAGARGQIGKTDF